MSRTHQTVFCAICFLVASLTSFVPAFATEELTFEVEAEVNVEVNVETEDVVVEDVVVEDGVQDEEGTETNVDEDATNDVEMQLTPVRNGWLEEEGKTHYYENSEIKTEWVVNDSYQNYGLQRYWTGAYGDLVTSQFVKTDAEGSLAYCTNNSYVARNKCLDTDDKMYLADNDGNLETTTGWLVTGKYDGGGLQRYYIDSSHCVKRGFFDVDGKRYLGDANQGYVARGKTPYGSGVLLIDNEGVINQTDGFVVSDVYDGGLQRYHLIKVCDESFGARFGFFNADGNLYYALPGVAYCWRNDYDYLDGHWYSANNDGVLTNLDGRFWQVERYVCWMLDIAADDSHGYDQRYRWGERGDYDCSSFTITALRVAGIDTKWATYTGNMRSALTTTGFFCRGFDNLRRGDILLNDLYHVAVYIGGGQIVHASGNEWGGAAGGIPGDQTGREICTRSYYDYPWNTVLRFNC